MGRVSRYKKFTNIDPVQRADIYRGKTKQGRLSVKSKANFDTDAGEDDFVIGPDGNPVFIDRKKVGRKKDAKASVAAAAEDDDGGDAIEAAFQSYTKAQQERMSKSLDRTSLVGGLKQVYKTKGQQKGSKEDKVLSGAKGDKKLFESRGESESMRAFNKRIKNETNAVLAASMVKSGTSERKKEYLKQRKKDKKDKVAGRKRKAGDTSDEDERTEKRRDVSADGAESSRKRDTRDRDEDFGEQAERPPEFKVLPKDRRKEQLKLLQGQTEETEQEKAQRRAEMKKKNEMAELSKKVQEAYRAMKAKKHKY